MRKVIFAAFAALGILAAGCTNEPAQKGNEEGTGAIRVSLKNAAGDTPTRLIGNPEQELENSVLNYGVFVFSNSSGAYETHELFTSSDDGVIEGLNTAFSKKIVVLVNYDFTEMDANPPQNYSELVGMTIGLETQVLDLNQSSALFMSGEASGVTISPTQAGAPPTEVTIEVARVVAKVRLNSLIVNNDPTAPGTGELTDYFQITGVSMQRVPNKAYMLGNATYTVDIEDPTFDTYYGGVASDISTSEWADGLYSEYELESDYVAAQRLTPFIYFYVFPNDAVENYSTLLTIHGIYDGKPAYYPLRINFEDLSTGGEGYPDGTFIKRNTIYSLNVTLTNLGQYADTPDQPALAGDASIVINVANWAGPLIQSVVW